jgi:hypothetical protein
MSNSYSCTDGVVNLQFKGHFEFKEALPMIADIFKDERFTSGINFLVGVSLTDRSRTTEEAFEFVDLRNSQSEFRRSKIAILVSRPVSYDFERMISVFLEDFEISLDVFKNLEDAKTWLKI